MAQEKDVLLYEVNFDEGDATKKAAALRVNIERLTKAKADLKKEFKDGSVSADEFGDSMQAIEKQLASAKKELGLQTKALADNERAQKSAQGSVEQLRAKVIQMNTAWDGLSESERNNANTGKQLQAQIKATTGELLDLEKSTGRAQRQVGQYEKGTKEAEESTEVFKDSIASLGKEINDLQDKYDKLSKEQRESAEVGGELLLQINSLTKTQEKNKKAVDDSRKGVKDYIRDINFLGISVGGTIDSFKSGAQGVGTFAKAIFTTRGALVALTAVPIVLLLTTVVSFLTKSKDGMELFGRKAAAAKAILDLFVGKLIDFGRAAVAAFENPGEAIKKLGRLIVENITNRLLAVGEILRGNLIDGFAQLLTGVTGVSGKVSALTAEMIKAARAGEAVKKEAYAIADAERALNVERAKSREEIEKNKLAAEDVSKSQQERVKAAERAFAIENGLLKQQTALQQRKIANIKSEMALSKKSADDLDKLAEAESRLAELGEESFGKQTELNNKVQALRIEGAKAALATQIATLNEGLRVTQERGFQTLEIEKQILAKQLELDMVGVIKGSEQEKALRLKYKADLATLIYSDVVKQNDRQNQLENDAYEQRLAQVRKGTVAELKLRKERIDQLAFQEKAAAEITIKDAIVKGETLKKIDAKRVADKKEINQQINDIELKALDDLIAARLARTKAGSQAEYKIQVEQIRKRIADSLADERIGEEERQKIQAEGLREISDLTDQNLQKIANFTLESLSQVTDGLSKLLDAQSQRQQATIDQQQNAALKSAGLSAEARTAIEEKFAKKKEKLEKEAAEKRRKIATIENIIAIAKGIVAAQTLTPPFSYIQAAIVAAVGAAQQAVISAQTFARGGEIEGPSHAQGGVKYVVAGRRVELEGNEGVINKRSMAIPGVRETASYLNELGGGVRFPGVRGLGNYVQPTRMELGGMVPASIATTTNATPIDYDKLAGMFAKAAAAIPAPQVEVVDIRSGIGKAVKVETNADTPIG